jgi:hypothetical protein
MESQKSKTRDHQSHWIAPENQHLIFPLLRSQPLWKIDKIVDLLANSSNDIRVEVDQVLKAHLPHFPRPPVPAVALASSSSSSCCAAGAAGVASLSLFDSINKSVRNGQWDVCYFMEEGDLHHEFTQLFPRTTEILLSLPLCRSCLGYSYISILSPGAEITPHAGATNTKLRIQLPLFNTEESIIIVDGRECKYEEGKPLIFDDSYVHSVRNFSSTDSRVVLLIDIWHPDLSPEMISDLLHLYPSPKSSFESEEPSSMNLPNSVTQSFAAGTGDDIFLPKTIRLDPRSTEVALPSQSQPPRAYDFLFKFLTIGDTYSGKSSFIIRSIDDTFSPHFLTTIGVDFVRPSSYLLDFIHAHSNQRIRTVEVDNRIIKIQMVSPMPLSSNRF